MEIKSSDVTIQTYLNKCAGREHPKSNKLLPIKWIAALFIFYKRVYGNKFTFKWNDMPQAEAIKSMDEEMQIWQEELHDITGEQFARGKETWKESWPPCIQEFRNACLKKEDRFNNGGYTPECYREKPVNNLLRISSDTHREKGRERIGKLKSMLRSGFDKDLEQMKKDIEL